MYDDDAIPRELIEGSFTELICIIPTRDDADRIDGAQFRVPHTVPGELVHELLTALGLESDDEWNEGSVLVITARSRSDL